MKVVIKWLNDVSRLAIEHALKVRIINDVEKDGEADGYFIVYKFLKANKDIISNLEKKTTSPFTGNLIKKYFLVCETKEPGTTKIKATITSYEDCPIWVFVELLSYGEFIRFYKYYYGTSVPVKTNLLHLVRCLRNATAHNNCVIANLKRDTSRPPVEIKTAVKNIRGLSTSQRQKGLSSRPMLEFAAMLYIYNAVVTEKVKSHHMNELKSLFYTRMLEKRAYFKDNELIKNSYKFACLLIENLVD